MNRRAVSVPKKTAAAMPAAVLVSPPVNAPRTPISCTAFFTPLVSAWPKPVRGTVAPAPANSGMVKLSVNLNPETAKALKDLSYLQDKSITETMRQAIAVLQYLDNERAQGRVIRTMDKNGKKVKEITVSN